MTGKKAGGKKKNTGLRLLNAVILSFCGLLLAAALGLGWFVYKQQAELDAKKQAKMEVEAKRQAELAANPPPKTIINDSVDETVRYAAAHGWFPCTGDCLKLATRGWHHQQIDGFAPSDYWMTYRYSGARDSLARGTSGISFESMATAPLTTSEFVPYATARAGYEKTHLSNRLRRSVTCRYYERLRC